MKKKLISIIILCLFFCSHFVTESWALSQKLPWDAGTSRTAFRISTDGINPPVASGNTSCGLRSDQSDGKIDFNFSHGTRVRSINDGIVDGIEESCTKCYGGSNCTCGDGYGNYIKIKHSNNSYSFYAHLSEFPPTISVGSTVERGQVIAYSGNTGTVNPYPTLEDPELGSHLHFEWRSCSSYNCIGPTGFIEGKSQIHPNEAGRLVCGTYNSQNESCAIPENGDWIVEDDCSIDSYEFLDGNITINNHALLTIESTGVLDIDFERQYLLIKSGGLLKIVQGGKIY